MSIQDIRKEIKNRASDNNCYIIDNLKVDLRKLKPATERLIDVVSDDYPYHYEDLLKNFEEELKKYCEYLVKLGLPFDYIDMVSDGGLIIKRNIYEEIIRDFMRETRLRDKSRPNPNFKDNAFEWHNYDTVKYIRQLKSENILDCIPFNFKFIPKYRDESGIYNSFSYFGIKENFQGGFKGIAPLRSLVNKLEDGGYGIDFAGKHIITIDEYLKEIADFSNAKPVNTHDVNYNSYFNKDVKKKKLIIKANFSDDNNVRLI